MENIGVILTSSFLAAALTSFVNWYLQRNNFKNDYFKKVIEYRVEAYKQVWELLNQFPFESTLDDDYEGYLFDNVGSDNFNRIISLLTDLTHNGYWLSDEMAKALWKYYNVISAFDDIEERDPNEKVRKMIDHYKGNYVFKQNTLALMYKDMANLHDVNAFFKKKKGN